MRVVADEGKEWGTVAPHPRRARPKALAGACVADATALASVTSSLHCTGQSEAALSLHPAIGMDPDAANGRPRAPVERRRMVRWPVVQAIVGHALPMEEPVTLHDIGAGG